MSDNSYLLIDSLRPRKLKKQSLCSYVFLRFDAEEKLFDASAGAGAATGYYKSPQHDPRDLAALSHRFMPDVSKVEKLEQRYQLFCAAAEAMAPLWPKLEQLAKDEQSQA